MVANYAAVGQGNHCTCIHGSLIIPGVPQLAAQQPPPPDYYAENLRHLLGHVRAHYGDLLSDSEQAFARRLLASSSGAQRLFARLVGRKGPWIRTDKLNYAEVDELKETLQELAGNGLIDLNPGLPADALLGLFTNDERNQLFPAIAKTAKAQWILSCVSRYGDAQVVGRVALHFQWLALRDYSIFARYQLLFFGDAQQDLTTFVLQDLGVLKYEDYQLSSSHRQFADREQLDRYLSLRTLGALSHRLEELPSLAGSLAASLTRPLTVPATRLEQRVIDKTLNRLGRWHERRGEFDQALDCYAGSTSHPARERSVRVLHKLGDGAAVQALLCQMRNAPRSIEEEDFAERFGAKQFGAKQFSAREKGVKPSRSMIPTTVIGLEGAVPSDIEQFAIETLCAPGALRALPAEGGRGWHLENRFSLGIAGLAFWPVIFAEVPGAFVNPCQSGPVDLRWPDFLAPRAAIIKEQLERLADEQTFVEVVRHTWQTKHGIANRLVSWRHFDQDLLDAVLAAIPASALLALARLVVHNLHRLRNGFPDLLLIYGPGDYEFVEVKGPTDALQPGQRVWFKALAELQLPARVVKFKP
jgi:hypothetical protein